jgi:hypothetical protein
MIQRELEIPKRLYFDLEKFHRIIGYYEGQKIKPLEVHEKHISGDLEKFFRAPDQYIRRMQFDLFMTNVLWEQHRIFETDKPEATLLYLLFAEGIKSLVLLRDLSALEIKEWCVLVRDTLVALDNGDSKDLASVLWKTPFRNLRTRIYNSLMDLTETRREKREQDAIAQGQPISSASSAPIARSQTEVGWHEKDSEWDVPSAENVQRSIEASRSMGSEEFCRLKDHLSSTSEKTYSNPILQISDHELELLSGEMSMYDQSHVEFNLLSWNLSVLDGSFGCDPETEKHIEESLSQLTRSFVSRFHPGLILHLMDHIDSLKQARFESLRDRLKKVLEEAVSTPSNIKQLIDSLRDPTRARLSQRLFPFVSREQLPSVVDFYLEKKDEANLLIFLGTLFKRDLPLSEILTSWGEERLSKILPLFNQIQWDQKNEFLIKSLRSKFPQVVKEASYYILKLKMKPDHAYDIFRKLPAEILELWIKTLRDSPHSEDWKGFVETVAKSELWLKFVCGSRSSWFARECPIFHTEN